MPLQRNKDVPVAQNPRISKKRTLFDPGVKSRRLSVKHGVVTPFYVREVYPGDTWIVDHTLFIRSDTTTNVPLDDIIVDTYYFYLPYRIIYPDFYRVFGEKRNAYDNTSYSIPQITLKAVDMSNNDAKGGWDLNCLNQLIYRMGYSQKGPYQQADTVSALPLCGYYMIMNEYFLDENLDPQIPFADLFNTTQFDLSTYSDWDDLYNGGYDIYSLNDYRLLGMYQANKKIDLFTAGLISPAKTFGANTSIPLGTSAPVGIKSSFAASDDSTISGLSNLGTGTNTFIQLKTQGSDVASDERPLIADLSEAISADIQTFRTSLIIYSYYEMRGTIGTRRVEQLKQWGLDVSASELDIPEYLGGESIPLSNVPVLATDSSQLGRMSGVGATLAYNNSNAWSRSFNECGIIIGVCVARVQHTYSQGKDNRIWAKKTDLDFYHWIYEALGNVGLRNDYIFNDPSDGKNEETFNFSPAWNPERTDWNISSGVFSPMSGNLWASFRTSWSYGDIYGTRPVFSSDWLKEPWQNVGRTMSGRLLPGSNMPNGEQYLFEFKIHAKYARIMRSHAKPANLVGVYW